MYHIYLFPYGKRVVNTSNMKLNFGVLKLFWKYIYNNKKK